jgi:hypothetical protein
LPKHEYFEELAAVAALGELSPVQSHELELHLAECPDCKEILNEYERLHVPVCETLDPETEALIESRRSAIKSGVMQKVKDSRKWIVDSRQKVGGLEVLGGRGQGTRARQAIKYALAAAAAIMLAFWFGVRYDRTLYSSAQVRRDVPPSMLPATESRPAPVSGENKGTTDDKKYAETVEGLRLLKRENASLETALSAKQVELSTATEAQTELEQHLNAELAAKERTEVALTEATSKVKQLEASKSEDSATLVALRYQVEELNEKLKTESQSLDHERELLANGRDIRDIIGARNLHIIDVYDTGPEGKTSKSFARAFYTEGRSLVFYAYDLPSHGTDEGKFVYTAWGEKNGNTVKVQKLGILLNDDKGQRRWALNFSDPKVLNEIDSVFVTLERVDTDLASPHGKRMLTAYLDSQVNHP